MIDGVQLKKLKVMTDERGRLMEILRRDDEMFTEFGQVYMTTAYPGVVKAWHSHERQDDYFTCILGMMKLVLYDNREGSPTHGRIDELFVGAHNPVLVKIPRGVLHGFKGIGTEEAVIVNTVTTPYDYENPDEIRLDPHDPSIPYDWARKDG